MVASANGGLPESLYARSRRTTCVHKACAEQDIPLLELRHSKVQDCIKTPKSVSRNSVSDREGAEEAVFMLGISSVPCNML